MSLPIGGRKAAKAAQSGCGAGHSINTTRFNDAQVGLRRVD